MTLPHDDRASFAGIPLDGHLCSLRRGGSKYYWQVEKLIEASRSLPLQKKSVADLLPRISNGSWFGATEKVTIGKILPHLHRIMNVDLSFPIILAADGSVMDGSHRLVAASIKGFETVTVVQFQKDPDPAYVEETGKESVPDS